MNEQAPMVLILDDDEAVRESLVAHFEDRGWRTLAAATAEDALEVAQKENPDGAIVDIRLPGIDGNEFIRAITTTMPTLVFVICTGSPEYAIPEDVANLRQVSAEVFGKPVPNLAELEDALLRQIAARDGREDRVEF